MSNQQQNDTNVGWSEAIILNDSLNFYKKILFFLGK